MSEKTAVVKFMARLHAVQILLFDIYLERYLASDNPIEAAQQHRNWLQQGFPTLVVPGVADAATSDLLSAEITDYIDGFVGRVIDVLCTAKPKRG